MTADKLKNTAICLATGAAALILLVLANPSFAGKLYKWTDEKGVVHYSDKLPPESVKNAHKQLSDKGLVKEDVERAKTDEERMAEKVQENLDLEERRRQAAIQAKQNRRDRILLDTFTTERDLLLTRDDRLNSIDSIINLTKNNNKRFVEQLETVKGRIEKIENSGREVPKNMRDQLTSLTAQHDKNQKFIGRKQDERKKLEDRFNADLERFRELKGLSSAPTDGDEKEVTEKEAEETEELTEADELPDPPETAEAEEDKKLEAKEESPALPIAAKQE